LAWLLDFMALAQLLALSVNYQVPVFEVSLSSRLRCQNDGWRKIQCFSILSWLPRLQCFWHNILLKNEVALLVINFLKNHARWRCQKWRPTS